MKTLHMTTFLVEEPNGSRDTGKSTYAAETFTCSTSCGVLANKMDSCS